MNVCVCVCVQCSAVSVIFSVDLRYVQLDISTLGSRVSVLRGYGKVSSGAKRRYSNVR